jgi:hypothetical protein
VSKNLANVIDFTDWKKAKRRAKEKRQARLFSSLLAFCVVIIASLYWCIS